MDPTHGPSPQPTLIVMWHGNRVQVFGDGSLGPGARRGNRSQVPGQGVIAEAIGDAETVPDIVTALRASSVGETHDVTARVVDGVLQLWLRERAPGIA